MGRLILTIRPTNKKILSPLQQLLSPSVRNKFQQWNLSKLAFDSVEHPDEVRDRLSHSAYSIAHHMEKI
jgi:hypothetical protein